MSEGLKNLRIKK